MPTLAAPPRPSPKGKPKTRPTLEVPELDDLVGLQSVREHLRDLLALVWVEGQRNGVTAAKISMGGWVFTGRPGVGKTTVAASIGKALKRIGVLPEGHVVLASRAELVGQYIGDTAPKVNAACDRAKGGVLFIDEAYSLVSRDSSRDFGHEAVATLLQRMESDRGQMLVIIAGYPKETEEFLHCNPGLASRFSVRIPFPDYGPKEAVLILMRMMEREKLMIGKDSRDDLCRILIQLTEQKDYANARSVRSLFETMKLRQARRIAQGDGDDLFLFTSQDLPTLPKKSLPQAIPTPSTASDHPGKVTRNQSNDVTLTPDVAKNGAPSWTEEQKEYVIQPTSENQNILTSSSPFTGKKPKLIQFDETKTVALPRKNSSLPKTSPTRRKIFWTYHCCIGIIVIVLTVLHFWRVMTFVYHVNN